jgi:hypothetical protein
MREEKAKNIFCLGHFEVVDVVIGEYFAPIVTNFGDDI